MKNMLKIAGFLAVLLVLLQLCGLILIPKTNDPDGGIFYPEGMGILSEPENSVDVLFIGDSEVCAAFSPMELWQSSGITSYACSSVDQQLFETQVIADRALKNQSPKVVFMETNVFYRHMNRLDIIKARINEAFPAVQHHDRWKTLSLRDFNPKLDYSYHSYMKGFYHSWSNQPADTANYMTPDTGADRPEKVNESFIRDLVDQFTSIGAKVIFVTSPNTMNWDAARSNGVAALAQEIGVTYIDMNSMPHQIPIDWQTDTRDKGDHLNTFGAIKVMAYLSGYLDEHFDLPDHRGDAAFSQWDADLAAYQQEIQ